MGKILLLAVFLCSSMLTLCKGEETITSYIPQSDSTDNIEIKIKSEIEAIKTEYANDFIAYDALRENKPSLCGGKKGCKNVVQGGVVSKLWAEGKCSELTGPIDKKICEGINNNCNNLSGWKAAFCRAFIANDVKGLKNSFNSREAREEFKKQSPTANDLAWTLALYSGFKQSNPLLCQTILANSTLPLEERTACAYIFSNDSNVRGEIMRDLAIFRLSQKEKDIKYCDLIKSDLIKYECIKNK